MAAETKFSKTERRIMQLLDDGTAHSKERLLRCLNDELASVVNLQVHISNIRKKIRPLGRDIVLVNKQYLQIRMTSVES